MLDVYFRLSTAAARPDSSTFCPANVHSLRPCESPFATRHSYFSPLEKLTTDTRNRHEVIAIGGGYTCVWCAQEFYANCLQHGTRCGICEARRR